VRAEGVDTHAGIASQRAKDEEEIRDAQKDGHAPDGEHRGFEDNRWIDS
jgi:hypothetical protein